MSYHWENPPTTNNSTWDWGRISPKWPNTSFVYHSIVLRHSDLTNPGFYGIHLHNLTNTLGTRLFSRDISSQLPFWCRMFSTSWPMASKCNRSETCRNCMTISPAPPHFHSYKCHAWLTTQVHKHWELGQWQCKWRPSKNGKYFKQYTGWAPHHTPWYHQEFATVERLANQGQDTLLGVLLGGQTGMAHCRTVLLSIFIQLLQPSFKRNLKRL